MAPIRHVSHAIKTVPDSLSGGVQKIFTKVQFVINACTVRVGGVLRVSDALFTRSVFLFKEFYTVKWNPVFLCLYTYIEIALLTFVCIIISSARAET